MKVTIKGFVVAQQYPWDDAPQYTFVGFDPRECGIENYFVVSAHEFDFDVPDDFDVRPAQIEILEKKKQELHKKFSMAVKEINDQINSLLAIGQAKVVNDGTTD